MIDISVTGLVKSFDLEKKILDGITFQIDTGERVGLLGKNGAGKTTLFRILTGELDYDAGEVSIASGRRLGLISQIPVYPEGYTVEDVLKSAFSRMQRMEDEMNALSQQMASGDESEETLRRYGELSRLKLCILMDEEVNLLILDEPTNHLDIASREWIEEAVESYDGTLLFVSHDRYFINRFATRVWELENGVITDYPMGFARYRQVKALEAQNKIDHTPKAVKEKTVTEKPKPNRSAQQARRQLTICEKEISAQETAIAEIEQRLEEAGGDYERYSEIYKEKEAAEQKLSELMEKWETLAEQAGE